MTLLMHQVIYWQIAKAVRKSWTTVRATLFYRHAKQLTGSIPASNETLPLLLSNMILENFQNLVFLRNCLSVQFTPIS